jgi:signal transduction histidine kinase
LHWLPRSLFGRLTLVLLTGLVAAQLLSAAILLRDRGQSLYQSARSDLLERTVGIVRLLDALPPQERRRLVPLLSTPERPIRLARAPRTTADTRQEGENNTERAIEDRLRALLPPGTKVHVEPENLPTDGGPAPEMPDMPNMHRRHMMASGRMSGPWAYLHGVHDMEGGFFIQIALTDGTWVQLQRQLPQDLLDQPTRVLLTLTILLLSVVALSLLAVHWVTRPLRALRLAAEALGRDIRRRPLAETGPREVAETARAFNTMQRRIRRFVEDRSRILAAVSHDLKTPLTRLRLRSDLLDDELRAKIQTDLDDMESMVGATLDFMRGTEGREETRRLDLTALLETIADDARDAGWQVSLRGQEIGPIQGRPTALKRCIANLVDNAARYGGSAEILAEDDGRTVRISVLDRGPGIPEALLEQAFDPFFRLESSRARHTGGTGLGLGIARNIARAHGGDLMLRNREGGGLSAELALPR